jgi:hypothetical protein
VPSEDPDLAFLTRLLQLAVGCRAMLRQRRFVTPEPVSFPTLTAHTWALLPSECYLCTMVPQELEGLSGSFSSSSLSRQVRYNATAQVYAWEL